MRTQTTKPSHQSIVGRLYRAQAIINTAIDHPEIAELLSGYGYTTERLREGKELYETVQGLYHAQKLAHERKQQMVVTVANAWEQAQLTYTPLLKLIRIALKDNPAAGGSLAIHGERHQNLKGWSNQARLFYTNILKQPELLGYLAQFNISEATIQQHLAAVHQIEALRLAEQHTRSEARQAVAVRDEALSKLGRWTQELLIIARPALGSRPDLLERLVRSAA